MYAHVEEFARNFDTVDQVKYLHWLQLYNLSVEPDSGELFQSFAAAIKAELPQPQDSNLIDLIMAGLSEVEVKELTSRGFMQGERGEEGFMPVETRRRYAEQLQENPEDSSWRVIFPAILGSVH